jgi:hypothetical protein
MNRTIYAVLQGRIDRVDVGKGRVNDRAQIRGNSQLHLTHLEYLHSFPLLLSVARYINPIFKQPLML